MFKPINRGSYSHCSRLCIHYEGRTPCFWVNDIDLIKRITITDFNHFSEFAFMSDENKALPINDLGLGSRVGEEWK